MATSYNTYHREKIFYSYSSVNRAKVFCIGCLLIDRPHPSLVVYMKICPICVVSVRCSLVITYIKYIPIYILWQIGGAIGFGLVVRIMSVVRCSSIAVKRVIFGYSYLCFQHQENLLLQLVALRSVLLSRKFFFSFPEPEFLWICAKSTDNCYLRSSKFTYQCHQRVSLKSIWNAMFNR